MTREKFARSRHAKHQAGFCPVDIDGRRVLSVKTVVVHNSVKSLMMETNL